MRRHRATTAAAAAAATMLGGVAVAAPPISKTEIRRDPPALTNRRLKDLMWDMFVLDDERRPTPPKAVLRSTWMRTKPVGTRVANLCRYDIVIVDYAPTQAGPRDADTPVRPVGLGVNHVFRFLAPPPLDGDEKSAIVRVGGPCAALDTKSSDGFFEARDEADALDGMVAVLKLRRAIVEKRPVDLVCDIGDYEKRPCPAVIEASIPGTLGGVKRCEVPRGEVCFLVDAAPGTIRIVLADEGPREGQVISAKAEGQIVIADTLID